MKEGDVVLVVLPQSNGVIKNRPALILRSMPPFGNWLVCGISTQRHQPVSGFDGIIDPAHPAFAGRGLKSASVIRLGFLAVIPAPDVLGKIGRIAPERHRCLLENLANHRLVRPHP